QASALRRTSGSEPSLSIEGFALPWPWPPPGGRFRISHFRRDRQFDLRSGANLAPDRDLAPHLLCTFVHSCETVVPPPAAGAKYFGLDPFAVITNPQTELAAIVDNLNSDPLWLSVLKRIAQCFIRELINFIQDRRRKVPSLAFYLNTNL